MFFSLLKILDRQIEEWDAHNCVSYWLVDKQPCSVQQFYNNPFELQPWQK